MGISHNKTNMTSEQSSKTFLNELVLNIVLKELSKELRQEFYTLIEQEKYEETEEFINKYIPDLEAKLLKRTKELFEKE